MALRPRSPLLPARLRNRPRYFNPAINQYRGGGNITGYVAQDQQFMVWMRLAPLPSLRKLAGVINGVTLQAGDTLQVSVVNQYNSFAFDGEKWLVASTATWLGLENPFLGIVFLVTGCLAVATGLVYLVVATWVRPRALGDLSVLPDSEWTK